MTPEQLPKKFQFSRDMSIEQIEKLFEEVSEYHSRRWSEYISLQERFRAFLQREYQLKEDPARTLFK